MIRVLLTRRHEYTIAKYLASGGAPLADALRALAWEDVFQRDALPGGTYLLSDFERLSPTRLGHAVRVADALEAIDDAVLLNHPARCLDRPSLLRRLHEDGTNPYAAHRLDAVPDDLRLPVFVRLASDHQGSRTALIETREGIEAAAARLERRGKPRTDVLVVEFQDTEDDRGWYRKYGAFRVADRIVARHLFFGRHWNVKAPSNNEAWQFEEETRYVDSNPHERELLRIFDLAGVDYGRIDYTLVGDRVCVWEINTNPMISIPEDPTTGVTGEMHARFHARFQDALRAVDTEPRGSIPLPAMRIGMAERLRERLRR